MTRRTPFTAAIDHFAISVRLTPRASANRIDGRQILADGSQIIAARVTAPPDGGKANAALVKLVAKELGAPVSAVSMASGYRARVKQLRVEGDPRALLDMAERLWPSSPDTQGSVG